MKIHAKNEIETIDAGEEFGGDLRGGDVVLLSGKLGAGKTTFVKGIAKALQVSTRIISPTFVITRTHKASHNAIKQIYHLDLYRIEKEEELWDIDIKNMVNDESVVLIEWPELSYSYLEKPYYVVSINYEGEGRVIEIHYEK